MCVGGVDPGMLNSVKVYINGLKGVGGSFSLVLLIRNRINVQLELNRSVKPVCDSGQQAYTILKGIEPEISKFIYHAVEQGLCLADDGYGVITSIGKCVKNVVGYLFAIVKTEIEHPTDHQEFTDKIQASSCIKDIRLVQELLLAWICDRISIQLEGHRLVEPICDSGEQAYTILKGIVPEISKFIYNEVEIGRCVACEGDVAVISISAYIVRVTVSLFIIVKTEIEHPTDHQEFANKINASSCIKDIRLVQKLLFAWWNCVIADNRDVDLCLSGYIEMVRREVDDHSNQSWDALQNNSGFVDWVLSGVFAKLSISCSVTLDCKSVILELARHLFKSQWVGCVLPSEGTFIVYAKEKMAEMLASNDIYPTQDLDSGIISSCLSQAHKEFVLDRENRINTENLFHRVCLEALFDYFMCAAIASSSQQP